MLAPPREPSVAATTIRKTLNFPAALRLPERGSMTSEGMGGNTASRAINRATPAYPMPAITFVTQATSCATSSPMQDDYIRQQSHTRVALLSDMRCYME